MQGLAPSVCLLVNTTLYLCYWLIPHLLILSCNARSVLVVQLLATYYHYIIILSCNAGVNNSWFTYWLLPHFTLCDAGVNNSQCAYWLLPHYMLSCDSRVHTSWFLVGSFPSKYMLSQEHYQLFSYIYLLLLQYIMIISSDAVISTSCLLIGCYHSICHHVIGEHFLFVGGPILLFNKSIYIYYGKVAQIVKWSIFFTNCTHTWYIISKIRKEETFIQTK